MALRTITPEHRVLRQISIIADSTLGFTGLNIRQNGEEISKQWSDLDRLLVQFSESSSIRPNVMVCSRYEEVQTMMRDSIELLLPEAAERGFIELRPIRST